MNNHILIIDDDEIVRINIAQHLRDEGYEVSAAATGEEGLSVLGKEGIDLVLLDLNLPDGDGLSIEQQVREKFSVPIIIVTARTGQDDKLMALSMGANEYLTKPVNEKELLLRVRNLLNLTGNGTGATSPVQLANAFAIEKALSLKVRDFIGRARTGRKGAGPTGRKSYGTLFRVLATMVVITVGGGVAVWYFGLRPEPPGASQPRLADPAESSLPGPIKLQPAPTPEKSQPPVPKAAAKAEPKAKAGGPVDLPVEEPTNAIAKVLGYGWVLNTKCAPLPDVKWWRYKSHEDIAGYVTRSLNGDWSAYIKTWYVRLVTLQDIDRRDSSAITSSGLVLKGPALKDYLGKMHKRLAVIRCLAAEAKAFAAKR